VNSQAPYPLVYDANGKSISGVINPDFLEWCKNNSLSKEKALGDQLNSFPAELLFMASTGDSRGLQILRRGLQSQNHGVRAVSAAGLATLQDRNSIPLIIEAAGKAPQEARWPIAQHLLSFEDHNADKAAEELISDKKLLSDLKQRATEQRARNGGVVNRPRSW
jgi:HEAT repeat protein